MGGIRQYVVFIISDGVFHRYILLLSLPIWFGKCEGSTERITVWGTFKLSPTSYDVTHFGLQPTQLRSLSKLEFLSILPIHQSLLGMRRLEPAVELG